MTGGQLELHIIPEKSEVQSETLSQNNKKQMSKYFIIIIHLCHLQYKESENVFLTAPEKELYENSEINEIAPMTFMLIQVCSGKDSTQIKTKNNI